MPGDASPPAGVPLLRVPPEILDRITWHLATTELGNFRLTCKAAEQAVHFRFTAEFFTRKQFMVSEFSLKALQDISKSRLAGYLRHVHISLDQVDEMAGARFHMTEEQRILYQQRVTEQSTLWTLGLVPKYLAEAFSRLPNLETVALRDFNSTRRSRDGPHAQWRSYGAQTLLKETGVLPITNEVFSWGNPTLLHRASILFKAVIHGLGLANARPKNIEVMERNGNLLHDPAFHLHPDLEAADALVLGSLEKLHLCVDVYRIATHHDAQPHYPQNLARFLKHCNGLQELRINGRRSSYSQDSRENLHLLMSWLASSEAKPLSELQSSQVMIDIQFAPPPVEFPQLSHLSLGMMAITLDEVVHLITKFAGSLQHLELWRLQLMANPGTDADIAERNQNLFLHLLKKLLAIPNLNLRHIKLGMLQQMLAISITNKRMQTLEFTKDEPASTNDDQDATAPVDTRCRRSPSNYLMEYTGSDWRHFVRHEMIPRLHITKCESNLARVAQSNHEGDSEDDDDDDDEGEGEDEEMDE